MHWTPRQTQLAVDLAAAWADVVNTRREFDLAWKHYQRYGGGYR